MEQNGANIYIGSRTFVCPTFWYAKLMLNTIFEEGSFTVFDDPNAPFRNNALTCGRWWSGEKQVEYDKKAYVGLNFTLEELKEFTSKRKRNYSGTRGGKAYLVGVVSNHYVLTGKFDSLTISVRWRSVLSAPRPKVPSTSPITRGPHAKTRGQDGLSSAEPGSR